MATTTLRAMCDQARRLLEQNDIDRSIAVAQHILQYFPDNLEAHRILGEAYLASRQFDQAQESFSRVLYADPENIPALVGLGITYERQGKIDRAVREFEQALEIKSDLKELREQLLRLYTDSWGAERAQLRLSKPGLARLYAKGHMFPQAIQEFRSVINDDPDRFDAQVGLAEVLWRDGQEEAAALVCEEILAQRDVVLKANLLLGYMKLTAGDPQGQHYWNVAQRLDPYQGVALALFETLPTEEEPQTTLPDWDEKAWLERQEQAERERRVQLEEELAVRSPVVQPDEDFFTNAWLDPTEEHPHSTAATTFDTTPDDDFLASLLAFEALDQPELAGVTDQPQASVDSEYAEADLKPFTLDDLDHPEHQVPAMQAAPEFPSEGDFNLDALLVGETATEEHTLPSGEGKDEKTEFQPFSLDDLGISDEDIAVPDMASELSVTTDEQPPVPVAFTDESSVNKDLGVQPFSLNDLGLSDEELAGLDLRHTDAELYPGAPSEERQSDDDLTNLKPFDWSQETGFSAAQLANDQVFESDIDDLQPFSLDDLDLSDSTLDTDMSRSSLPPSLQPFSLDDLGDITLTPDTTSNKFGSPLHTHLSDEEGEQEPSAFGWQQPAAKSNTDFLRHGHDMIDSDEPEETSIFAKLKQRRQELPDKEEMPLPPVSIEKHDSLDLFSDDDVSLRDDDEESTRVLQDLSEPQPAPPPDEPELTPFSLSELGLSPEEIAALESGQVATEATEPQPAPPPDEPELTPFSLSELGLSPEEIAALGMSDADAVDSMPSIADEVSAAHSAPPDAPTAQPDATPFPFEEWNLDDDDFSGLSTGITDLSGSENQSEISEPLGDIQPFSLSDLGLVTEESGVFGAESHLGQSELGLTEEELANLNIGMFDDHDHSREKTGSLVDDDQELTGDFELDKLIRLGRKQGFVDLTDIIEIVHDPVAQPERIEEIGQALHLAGIQIRDGDEIIDMDEEYLEEEDIAVLKNQQGDDVQTVDTDEPDLAPFSLGDLGLSAEEIAALGLEDYQSKVASPVAEPAAEPELTPLSLEELGLTPEEIAFLRSGTTTRPSIDMLAAAVAGLSASKEQDQDKDEDAFDFSVVDKHRDKLAIPVKRTEPRKHEEDVRPVPPEDADFKPEALDTLDNIWEMVDRELAQTPVPSAVAAATRPEPPPTKPVPAQGRSVPTAARPTAPARSATQPDPMVSQQTKPAAVSEHEHHTGADTTPSSPKSATRRSSWRKSPTSFIPTGDETLDEYLRQVEVDPNNHGLRLGIARLAWQTERNDLALYEYKHLIKDKIALDRVVDELQELIEESEDRQLLQRLYRLLGDAYSQQNRFREAIAAYSWTFTN